MPELIDNKAVELLEAALNELHDLNYDLHYDAILGCTDKYREFFKYLSLDNVSVKLYDKAIFCYSFLTHDSDSHDAIDTIGALTEELTELLVMCKN